jgi:hypothetical protein
VVASRSGSASQGWPRCSAEPVEPSAGRRPDLSAIIVLPPARRRPTGYEHECPNWIDLPDESAACRRYRRYRPASTRCALTEWSSITADMIARGRQCRHAEALGRAMASAQSPARRRGGPDAWTSRGLAGMIADKIEALLADRLTPTPSVS